jgi:hypothetical protein
VLLKNKNIMSKNTFFNTRFWQDSYIADLDPSEKLLFIYCITSPALSLCGIYEVPLRYIALETGLDREVVVKIFVRFEEKKRIIYRDGWVCVLNYPKYQSFKGEKLEVALTNEIKAVPKDILDIFIEYGYPMDTLSLLSMDMDMERDKDMEQDRGKRTRKKPDEKEDKREKYGESGLVRLEVGEYQKLCELLGEEPTKALIEEMDDYLGTSGKKYRSYYKALRTWARRKIQDHTKNIKKQTQTKRIII